jgi:ATP-binding cassette, subfamily C, bacterial CydC
MRELALFGRLHRQRERVDAATARLAEAERAQALRGGSEAAVFGILTGGGVLSVLALGLWQAGQGNLPVHWVPALVVLATGAFGPVQKLLTVTRVWGITSSAADRVFDVLEQPSPVPDDGTGSVPDVEQGLAVDFRGVTFHYPGAPGVAVSEVDLHVPAGSTVAIAGHTGAGKSTLAHLLLRYYDPDGGAVTLNGTDLRELSRGELTRLIAHVSQDVFLYHDTLAENLRLARPEATDAELRAACERARVTPFLDRLPDGLNTVVGERGATLSGGERQRVAIARALLKDAPVLVQDEASSQLDVLSEQEVAAALAEVRAGRTTLVIAHRLSVLRTADLVAVLERGRLLDCAPHDELYRRCPAYARVVRAQADAEAVPAPVRGSPDRHIADEERR